MQHRNKIKHLSFKNSCATNYLGRTFHPTIDLFQISTASQPQVRANNPQKRVVSHCLLIAQKIPRPTGIRLYLSQFSTSSLPVDLPNPRNAPLHCSQSIGRPIRLSRSVWHGLQRISLLRNSRELTATKTTRKNNNNHSLL
jgi:hypothetical protein